MKRLTGRASQILAIGLLTISSFAQATTEVEAVPGEYIVKLKDQHSLSSVQNLSQQLGSFVKDSIPNLNIVVIKRPVIEMQSFALKAVAENPMVEIVEPNYIYRINRMPNDPMLGELWGLLNVGQKDSSNKVGVAGTDVNAEKAWDISTGSQDVLLAVIDTGIDYTHPDLIENMWTNEAEANGVAGVDDDGNGIIDDIHGANFVKAASPTGNPMDDHGHGTHCAGTIGAKGDDGKGIVGVAWNVRMMGIKFLSASGSGSLDGALKGIDYATQMGAKILSNSWGGGGVSETLKQAIERSHQAGALFVAAAGNDSNNNDSRPTYPASYDVPNVMAIAAVDNTGKIASFSNYGKKMVHVGAPGVNVKSSVRNGGYASYSGTSMAAPHVSGLAVLLAAHEPNLTNVEIKQRIIATARPISGLTGKTSAGMVDAYNMLTNTVPPPDANDPANWQFVPTTISTAHPYANGATEEFEIRVPGAKQIAIYFSKFETERLRDSVSFYNEAGTLLGKMNGKNDDTFSPVFEGEYVKVVLTADTSINKYGFDITKTAWR